MVIRCAKFKFNKSRISVLHPFWGRLRIVQNRLRMTSDAAELEELFVATTIHFIREISQRLSVFIQIADAL